MVREVITVAALTAAFSFLGGCTPRAATLPGFRSETKEFSQSGETFGNPLMGTGCQKGKCIRGHHTFVCRYNMERAGTGMWGI